MKIAAALISVANKSGLPELADALAAAGAKLFASGGTAAALRQAGAQVADLNEITGDAEILDGRVKTLNTNLHAAVLADPENPAHLAELRKRGLPKLNLVVVNFYPFAKVAASGADEKTIIENIDIGGPALARAAAKSGAVVLTDPADYPAFVAELKSGEVSPETAKALSAKAFAEVARLDADIANHFVKQQAAKQNESVVFPSRVFLHLEKRGELRYGENPHQSAARYVVCGGEFHRGGGGGGGKKSEWTQAGGGALSYNNILDAQSARGVVSLFDSPAAVVVKHNNPCGVAVGDSLASAFDRARRGDPLSAFGGVVALNGIVDAECAKALAAHFLEVVVAPGFSDEAKKILGAKEKLRLAIPPEPLSQPESEFRIADGVALSQVPDAMCEGDFNFEVQSDRPPTDAELRALRFAWKCAAMLKSNAVALARGEMLVGAGAGQSSRVDAAKLACDKMARAELRGDESAAPLVGASDGFFPFPDAAQALLESGATAIAHPGGAKRDAEIAKVANDFGAALVVSGRRHFRH